MTTTMTKCTYLETTRSSPASCLRGNVMNATLEIFKDFIFYQVRVKPLPLSLSTYLYLKISQFFIYPGEVA